VEGGGGVLAGGNSHGKGRDELPNPLAAPKIVWTMDSIKPKSLGCSTVWSRGLQTTPKDPEKKKGIFKIDWWGGGRGKSQKRGTYPDKSSKEIGEGGVEKKQKKKKHPTAGTGHTPIKPRGAKVKEGGGPTTGMV